MIHFIVAVHDRQLDTFMRPFTAQSVGQALRSFKDETNREGSELRAHPEDYALYQLGTFNEQTGQVTSLDKPLQLALASNLVSQAVSQAEANNVRSLGKFNT